MMCKLQPLQHDIISRAGDSDGGLGLSFLRPFAPHAPTPRNAGIQSAYLIPEHTARPSERKNVNKAVETNNPTTRGEVPVLYSLASAITTSPRTA